MNNISKRRSLFRAVRMNYDLLLMLVPGLIYFIVFHYIPFAGLVIAFKDYNITKGIFGSDWVGLTYFHQAFSSPGFRAAFFNTITISFLKLILNFPVPIIFALFLNEIGSQKYKKFVQTVSYLPYFISWVVLASMFISVFAIDGPLNTAFSMLNIPKVDWLTDGNAFVWLLVLTSIWKGFGWGAIVYLAALSGINPEFYEAAIIDGATRWQRALYITIPSLSFVIIIMLILSTANILDAGFDQVFNLYNPTVVDKAEIIDTYVYKQGLERFEYSYSTAVGLFKSLVATAMVLITNFISHKLGGSEYGLF